MKLNPYKTNDCSNKAVCPYKNQAAQINTSDSFCEECGCALKTPAEPPPVPPTPEVPWWKNKVYLGAVALAFVLVFILPKLLSSDKKRKPVPSENTFFIKAEGGKTKDGDRIRGFTIAKYETTNREYCNFLNSKTPSATQLAEWIDLSKTNIEKTGDGFRVKDGFEKYPVSAVSWAGATAYCSANGGRLPTEKEWKYAAYGGQHQEYTLYSGSDDVNQVGNSENGAGAIPVGSKQANKLGLYDMSGNIAEWCQDAFFSAEKNYVRKGGSFWDAKADAEIEKRVNEPSTTKAAHIGFRIVKN